MLSHDPDDNEIEVKVVPRGDNSQEAQIVRISNDLAAKIWVRKA